MKNRRRWAVWALAAALGTGWAVGCGGSSSPEGTGGGGAEAGAGGTTPDAAAGTGGGGGTAGIGGTSGAGGSPDGGAGGTGVGGTAATGGDGGSAGTAAAGGDGGSAGVAGSAGAAGDGGSGGTGGGTCGVCNDGLSCTTDWCEGTTCKHAIGPNSGATACPAGQMCDLQLGCVQGPICASTAQCVQQLGADPCKTNIVCNPSVALCEYTWLDNDHDGYSPLVCGGSDCDDGDGSKAPGKAEACDGKDNDCNGFVDDGQTCPGLAQCIAGACTCPAENTCGTECVDKLTSNVHCGSCNHPCQSGSACTSGQCVCGSNSTQCPSGCVNLDTDPLNCGACGAICAPGFSCANKICTCTTDICSNQCVDKMTDANNCGACGAECGANQLCSGGQCVCAGGVPPCNGVCVNTQTDPNNCGGCGTKCAAGMTCQTGQCKCPSPLSQCGSTCVNFTNDPANCGYCGHSCSAGSSCVSSACVTCPQGDLMLLLDGSGSMVAPLVGAQTRWQAIQSATKNFVAQSTTTWAGLQLLPILTDATNTTCVTTADCTNAGDPFATCDTVTHTCTWLYPPTETTSCAMADYAAPKVALAALSSVTQRNAITAAIDAEAAGGSTPMTPALQGVLSYAKTRAQATAHRVAVVMITDGVPNDCPSTAVTADAVAVVQQYASGTPRIPTYVIGVGLATDADWAPTDWNQIAAGGGTTSFYAGSSQAQIESALAAIRNSYTTCP